MSAVTHVTEWGLADCAGVLRPGWASTRIDAIKRRMERRGLRKDTVACDGSSSTGRLRAALCEERPVRDVMTTYTRGTIPTCPRCAVLRDEALEGRLPARPVRASERRRRRG